MAKYIPLDSVVMEINRQIELLKPFLGACAGQIVSEANAKLSVLEGLKNFLDTLEVKEVDLEEEIDLVEGKCHGFESLSRADVIDVAKHFFELGMRVNNPVTASDRGTAEEIIINLKQVENDYRLDLTKEIEWVRNQVKKENSYGTIY